MPAFILAPFSKDQLDRLGLSMDVEYESWFDTRLVYDPDKLAQRLSRDRIEILVVEADFVFEEVFQQASTLRYVGICRNSTSHVDIDAATRHGVVVVNTPARNAQAVAEHALGLMLALARRIPAGHAYIEDGGWQNPAEPYMSMRGVELAGRSLGLIGVGAIGARLARIGAALGMKVLGYDPDPRSKTTRYLQVDLDTLMATADYISIHVPATPETEYLIDARRLAMMKPTAYLINTSDASVVDQEALARALSGDRIAGAACDVFESHPIAPDNPLLSLDNVVLTPHIGGATAETVERHSEMMTADILRFVRGRQPKNIVNREVWRRRG